MEALSKDCLPLVKMLHRGCDGPNVNKSLKNQLNESIVQLGGKPLIDIGSCNLHVVHNGFHAGISSVDQSWGVEDLMSDLFTFFKKYSSRAENFTVIQEALNTEKNEFLFNVQCLTPSKKGNAETNQMIHVLAASMPHLASDLRFLDSVSTEWRLYQADADISPDWAVTHDDGVVPVDKY